MNQRPVTAKKTNQSTLRLPVAAALALALSTLLAPGEVVADDSSLPSYAVPQPGTASPFGLVEASGLRWLHLSSRHGDLPVPTTSRQQTAAVIGRPRQGRT